MGEIRGGRWVCNDLDDSDFDGIVSAAQESARTFSAVEEARSAPTEPVGLHLFSAVVFSCRGNSSGLPGSNSDLRHGDRRGSDHSALGGSRSGRPRRPYLGTTGILTRSPAATSGVFAYCAQRSRSETPRRPRADRLDAGSSRPVPWPSAVRSESRRSGMGADEAADVVMRRGGGAEVGRM